LSTSVAFAGTGGLGGGVGIVFAATVVPSPLLWAAFKEDVASNGGIAVDDSVLAAVTDAGTS
jgi:hypothetical protein